MYSKCRYLQKAMRKKFEKNYILLASWRSLTKEQDPDPDPDSFVRGTDPDPYQDVTDPEHWKTDFLWAWELI